MINTFFELFFPGAVLGVAGGVSTIGITSHVSRIVSQQEIGEWQTENLS